MILYIIFTVCLFLGFIIVAFINTILKKENHALTEDILEYMKREREEKKQANSLLKNNKDLNVKLLSQGKEYTKLRKEIRELRSENTILKDVRQELESVLSEERKKQYYYSPIHAGIIRKRMISKFGYYIRKFVNGLEYTEAISHNSIDIPTYTDAKKIFDGLGEEIVQPFDAKDKEIQRLSIDNSYFRKRMGYYKKQQVKDES